MLAALLLQNPTLISYDIIPALSSPQHLLWPIVRMRYVPDDIFLADEVVRGILKKKEEEIEDSMEALRKKRDERGWPCYNYSVIKRHCQKSVTWDECTKFNLLSFHHLLLCIIVAIIQSSSFLVVHSFNQLSQEICPQQTTKHASSNATVHCRTATDELL